MTTHSIALDELLASNAYLPAEIYKIDMRYYAETLISQGVRSILVPLWLLEYHNGELTVEESFFHYIFDRLNANGIMWILLNEKES